MRRRKRVSYIPGIGQYVNDILDSCAERETLDLPSGEFEVRMGKAYKIVFTLAAILSIAVGSFIHFFEGIESNHKTVLKLMKSLHLRGKQSKNGKYHSYKGEVGKVAGNLLKRDFHADKPYEKLTTDVTEFKIGDEKVYLSPVLDMFNREIISYSISTSPNLQQVRDMLTGLFEKLPTDARPLFHSDQGWQYQHAEYQRLLAEHNITQSMSRKGNCMDNGIMENFFGRLKVEMYYGEKFESPRGFIEKLEEYIHYYNNERISLKLKGMSPVQYRAHSQMI